MFTFDHNTSALNINIVAFSWMLLMDDERIKCLWQWIRKSVALGAKYKENVF